VLTFDPFGGYGHPDHIAISQLAMAAIVAAANPSFDVPEDLPAHVVSKLYYMAWTDEDFKGYEAAFGELVMTIDGVERRSRGWPDWAATARIDTSSVWQTVWQAIACHKSQLPGYQSLLDLPSSDHQRLWGSLTFYRAFSLVEAGRAEVDLFEGLR
jgi:LmbE family N-acetylglucosaminyl deacetylase